MNDVKNFMNQKDGVNIGASNISMNNLFSTAQTHDIELANGDFVPPHRSSEFYGMNYFMPEGTLGVDYFVTNSGFYSSGDVPAATTWTGKSNIHCNADGGVGHNFSTNPIPIYSENHSDIENLNRFRNSNVTIGCFCNIAGRDYVRDAPWYRHRGTLKAGSSIVCQTALNDAGIVQLFDNRETNQRLYYPDVPQSKSGLYSGAVRNPSNIAAMSGTYFGSMGTCTWSVHIVKFSWAVRRSSWFYYTSGALQHFPRVYDSSAEVADPRHNWWTIFYQYNFNFSGDELLHHESFFSGWCSDAGMYLVEHNITATPTVATSVNHTPLSFPASMY
jgi:hypothetical protein